MILVKDLSIERSNKKIFENVNLSLGTGKIIILKGENGSGKTTLLKSILNLIEPTSGSIYWKGKLLNKNLNDFYNHVTYIADKTTSLRKLTVQDNINIWKKIFLSKIGKYLLPSNSFPLNSSIIVTSLPNTRSTQSLATI